MKQYLINLWTAIKKGLVRIFPEPVLYLLLILTVLTVYSCSTTHHTTQLVHDVRTDTLYLSNVQYDSIYVCQDHWQEYHPSLNSQPSTLNRIDTILIKDATVEYKYRMLHDTVEQVKIEIVRDSIPYEVTKVVTKEIKRPLSWFDHLTRACFWILSGIILFYIIRLIRKLKPF